MFRKEQQSRRAQFSPRAQLSRREQGSRRAQFSRRAQLSRRVEQVSRREQLSRTRREQPRRKHSRREHSWGEQSRRQWRMALRMAAVSFLLLLLGRGRPRRSSCRMAVQLVLPRHHPPIVAWGSLRQLLEEPSC